VRTERYRRDVSTTPLQAAPSSLQWRGSAACPVFPGLSRSVASSHFPFRLLLSSRASAFLRLYAVILCSRRREDWASLRSLVVADVSL
jgi:hypothetical protein